MTDAARFRAEHDGFVMVPRWLLRHPQVTAEALRLYCVLADTVDGREGPTPPMTRDEVAELAGVSLATLKRHMAALVAAGGILRERRTSRRGLQLRNVYVVRWSPPRPDCAGRPDVDRLENEPVGDNPGRLKNEPARGFEPPDRLTSEPPSLSEEKNTPQPPHSGGGDRSAREPKPNGRPRAAGTNPRALGTNPRGPRPDPTAERVASLTAAGDRARALRAGRYCPDCGGTGWTLDADGAAARCAHRAPQLT